MKNNIYDLRKTKGVTQKALAEYLGISYQSIQKYENGTNQADYQTLCKLSEYFDVSVDYLIGNKTPQKKSELSKEEKDWLNLLSELKANCGDEALQAVQALVVAFIKQNKVDK